MVALIRYENVGLSTAILLNETVFGYESDLQVSFIHSRENCSLTLILKLPVLIQAGFHYEQMQPAMTAPTSDLLTPKFSKKIQRKFFLLLYPLGFQFVHNFVRVN